MTGENGPRPISPRSDKPTESELARRSRRVETAILAGWLLVGSSAAAFWLFSFALGARTRFESLFPPLDGR